MIVSNKTTINIPRKITSISNLTFWGGLGGGILRRPIDVLRKKRIDLCVAGLPRPTDGPTFFGQRKGRKGAYVVRGVGILTDVK